MRERRKMHGKRKIIFPRCWGRFSTMLCLENLPQHLKNVEKGRKKGKGNKKDVWEGNIIFSKVLGTMLCFENLHQHLKK